jgi:hypothetical protein
LDPHATITTGAAYMDYSSWANEEVGWALSKLKFRRHLGDRGFTPAKGTRGVRLIAGLCLKPINGPSGPIGTTADGSQVYDDAVVNTHNQGETRSTDSTSEHGPSGTMDDGGHVYGEGMPPGPANDDERFPIGSTDFERRDPSTWSFLD